MLTSRYKVSFASFMNTLEIVYNFCVCDQELFMNFRIYAKILLFNNTVAYLLKKRDRQTYIFSEMWLEESQWWKKDQHRIFHFHAIFGINLKLGFHIGVASLNKNMEKTTFTVYGTFLPTWNSHSFEKYQKKLTPFSVSFLLPLPKKK